MTLLLKESHLRELLARRDLVPLMERALAAFSAGGVAQPVRTRLSIERHSGFLLVMPAYLMEQEALGLKMVGVYPGNAARDLPTVPATMLLFSPETGMLLAMMDGGFITEMRTAAVSVAATKHLARKEAHVLAILGAGAQARSHVEALVEVRPFTEVRVWARTRAHAEACAAMARERFGLSAAAAATAEEAVRGADVICTATASTTPVLKGAWLASGAHINAVGAPRPDWRELDTEAVVRSRLFVDSRAAAVVEAGDIVGPIAEGAISEAHIQAEIGQVFAGAHPGRTGPAEVTLFKSLGLAVEDVATAQYAYQQARARRMGEEVTLE